MSKIRNLLNKYNADNLSELFASLFSKIKKQDTPDDYVQNTIHHQKHSPRKFDLDKLFEENRLADMLPYEWFDSDSNIYQTTRAYGFIFECGVLTGAIQNLDDQLKSLFNLGIPNGTCMQVLLIASSELQDQFDSYTALRTTPLLQRLAQERVNFFKQGLHQSLKSGYKFPVRDFRLIISFAFDGLYEENNKASILSLQQSISSVLKNCGMANILMQPTQLINLIREILCCSTQPLETHIYDKRRAIRDQIADPDNNIYIAADGMCINDLGVKSIAISKYPDQFSINQCPDFSGNVFNISAQISYPFLLVQNITFLDQAKENTKLHGNATATAKQVKPGKFTSLFNVFHKKHAEYKLLQNAISNGEGLMYMSHYIHVYYPLGQGEAAFQEVKSLYQTFGFSVVPNSNLQLPSILCSLPLFHDFSASLAQKKYRMMSLYTQTNVVNLMPLFADYKGSGSSILAFLSRRGQLQYFDLFKTSTNYNVAISATTGSGKSFLTNEIVTSYLATQAKVRIIDMGGSYKDTCNILDGQYIEFSDKVCINPFSFITLKFNDGSEFDFRNISKEQLLTLEDLDDQITMLKAIFLVSAGIGEDNPNYNLADGYFEQAILNSLQKYQRSSTFTTVYNELLLLSQSDPSNVIKDLAVSIKSYTKDGIFGKYFEGSSNLNLDNNFVVLELQELQAKGNLKFIVLLILMLKIAQEMYLSDRAQRKICIIDEAWNLMDGGNTGKFIVTGYRCARKFTGSFITITQKIDDYFMNATTQACYSNAAWKIMLMQEAPTKTTLEPYTLKQLNSIRTELGVYSELLIQIEKTETICRFMVDSFAQLMYSTYPNDVALIKTVKSNEQLPTLEAIEKVLYIIDRYTTKFNRPKTRITDELMLQINKYGYQVLLANLVDHVDHLEQKIG